MSRAFPHRQLAVTCCVTLISWACGSVPSSPTSPTPPPHQPVLPSAPAPPSSPPFAVVIEQGIFPAHPGLWSTFVRVSVPLGVISTERPETLHVTCAGETVTRDAGFGSIHVSCHLPSLGEHQVQATVTGTHGFSATSTRTVRAIRRTPSIVNLFYDVILSYQGGRVDMIFGTLMTDEAYRYLWDFDDGSTDRTIGHTVRHTYCCRSRERVVRVTLIDDDGVAFAAGTVQGRW